MVSFTLYNSFQTNGITRIETDNGRQGKVASQQANEIETEIFTETKVFPNPTTGMFNIDLTNEVEIFNKITVFNLLGQQNLTQNVYNKMINEIDLAIYANSIYIVTCQVS